MITNIDDNLRVKTKSTKKDTEHIHILTLQKRIKFLWFYIWENISGYRIELQVGNYWGARIKRVDYRPLCGSYAYGGHYEVWLPEELNLEERIQTLAANYKSNIFA
jgi:hypothetical protein